MLAAGGRPFHGAGGFKPPVSKLSFDSKTRYTPQIGSTNAMCLANSRIGLPRHAGLENHENMLFFSGASVLEVAIMRCLERYDF